MIKSLLKVKDQQQTNKHDLLPLKQLKNLPMSLSFYRILTKQEKSVEKKLRNQSLDTIFH